jgi:hypothetical protein
MQIMVSSPDRKRAKLLGELQQTAEALRAAGVRAEILGNGKVVVLPGSDEGEGEVMVVEERKETDVLLYLPRSMRSIQARSGECWVASQRCFTCVPGRSLA